MSIPFVVKELSETADISAGKAPPGHLRRILLLGGAILVAAYLLLGLGAWVLAESIPDAWERQLFGGVTLPRHRTADAELLERPQALLDSLLAADPQRRALDYRLFLLDWKTPNAVAVAGGAIGVTPSLLEILDDDRALAFVLAHELGHHQERHVLHRIGRMLVYRLALSMVLGVDGGVSESGLRMAEAAYSRDQEYEADRYGLNLIHQTYGSVDGCLAFFEHLLESPDHQESAWALLAASHPLTRRRITALRQQAERWSAP